MKKTLFAWMFLALFLLGFAPVFADEEETSPSKAAATLPGEKMLYASVQQQGVIEFSARELEIRLGLSDGSLQGITITSIPARGDLFLHGAALRDFTQLRRDELDELCFVPDPATNQASFSFISDSPDRTSATFWVTVSETSAAPLLPQELTLYTYSDVAVFSGPLAGADAPEMQLQITRPPKKGTAKSEGQSLSYQPFSGLFGTDTFCYVFSDAYGNLSREATVTVQISKNESGTVFADMAGNPHLAAALSAQENGVLSSEKIGSSLFFYPERTLTQSQFLVSLFQLAGISVSPAVVVQTSLQNDRQIPAWLKPYAEAAVQNGILAGQTFHPQRPVTREQAVLYLTRAFLGAPAKSALSSLSVSGPAVAKGVLRTPPVFGLDEDLQADLTRELCAELFFYFSKFYKAK